MSTKHEDVEEGDDVAVKHALAQLSAVLQLNSNDQDHVHVDNHNFEGILDEKAKLILKRLLDCATEHAVKSHSEVITDKAGQIYSQWQIISKESLDATNSQALWFNSQPGGNHPDHVETNVLDVTLGASNCCSAKAIQRTNAIKPLDHQISPQTVVDSVKEKKWVGIHHRPAIADLIQEMKVEAFQYNGPTEKLRLSGQTTSKKVKMSGHIQSQGNNFIQRENKIPSRTAPWKGGNSKISVLADQKSHSSRNRSLSRSKTERNREDSLRTRRSDQTKAIIQRRNTGTALTTTLGPTLLRTASAHLHFRKDHRTQVEENDERWGSDQRSFRIGNKTSTSKGQSRQISILPTLPVDKGCRKNERRSRDSHTKRIGAEKNSRLASPIGHLPSRLMTKTRTTSISTSSSSDSTWTGSSSSPTDSEDSVPRRTMTRQRVNSTSSYVSSAGSIRPSRSRRTSHYSMVAPPLHAGPTSHMKNTKKQTGRLQRFKNKLGLIFHHHHHHHHHHHNDGGEAAVSQTALSNPSHSFWKSLRNILHRSSKDAQRKNRRHHQEAEHGIIDGLMKHVWHSNRKSKQSGDVKRLRKMHTRKVVQKWHWWQRFYKRRGVVRQSSIRKPNVRWGFKGRKPQLRALKHR